jgi:hypothetical protein
MKEGRRRKLFSRFSIFFLMSFLMSFFLTTALDTPRHVV